MYSLMIVDDEKWIRRGLVEAIDWASLGISTVREAENGEQALMMAQKAPPDLVITDIRMSGMGGLLLCDQLGALYPDIRMILISGYRDFSYAQQAIRLGVSDYLLKPIDERALLKTVEQCLFQIEKRRALSAGAEAAPAPRSAQRDEMHPAVRQLINYIDKNYAGKITLSSAARMVHMNVSYLSKLFSDETGQTFTHYIARVRVERAKEMLSALNMKIYQVARNVGYPDVKYFVSVFKEITGQTPSEWRQRREA